MQGPSSLAFVKLEFVYSRAAITCICRTTTFAGYSVHFERAAAPVPRPFSLRKLRRVLTRAFPTKVTRKKKGRGENRMSQTRKCLFLPRNVGTRYRYRQKARDRRYLRVILRLQEIEVLLDPVAGLGDRELIWLVGLRWALRNERKT